MPTKVCMIVLATIAAIAGLAASGLIYYFIAAELAKNSSQVWYLQAGSCISSQQYTALGTRRFAQKLYSALALAKPEQNLIISPLSISLSMVLLAPGAQGNTEAALADTFQYPCDLKDLIDAYKEVYLQILYKPTRSNHMVLSVTNRIFVNQKIRMSSQYRSILREYFLSTPQSINLDIEHIEASIHSINQLVKAETHAKIEEILHVGSISSHTNFILISAIYFQGLWNFPFVSLWTEKSVFYGYRKDEQVYMMSVEAEFRTGYWEEGKTRILEIPYRTETRMSLYILMPDVDSSISHLQEALLTTDDDVLGEILEDALEDDPQATFVSMPKFRLEQRHHLQDIFEVMGAQVLFDPDEANFKNLFSDANSPLNPHLDFILQEAFIEISESGTEAAAASGVSVRMNTAPRAFYCNKPFVFVIKEDHPDLGQLVWFMGRIMGVDDPEDLT